MHNAIPFYLILVLNAAGFTVVYSVVTSLIRHKTQLFNRPIPTTFISLFNIILFIAFGLMLSENGITKQISLPLYLCFISLLYINLAPLTRYFSQQQDTTKSSNTFLDSLESLFFSIGFNLISIAIVGILLAGYFELYQPNKATYLQNTLVVYQSIQTYFSYIISGSEPLAYTYLLTYLATFFISIALGFQIRECFNLAKFNYKLFSITQSLITYALIATVFISVYFIFFPQNSTSFYNEIDNKFYNSINLMFFITFIGIRVGLRRFKLS